MKLALRSASASNSTCTRAQRVHRRGTSLGLSIAREAEREQRIIELLPQVRYIARRVHKSLPGHVPFEDCFQAGVVGLMDAFRRFDPCKKVSIKSFAAFRIRGAILDELRSVDWASRDLRRKAREMEQTKDRLRAQLGRNPMVNELATGMRIPLPRLHGLQNDLLGLDLKSLQETVVTSKDGRTEDYASQLAAPESTCPLFACASEEVRVKLASAIRRLPVQEQRMLTFYYYNDLTMKEVGKALFVGESRVSQIHSSALARLRVLLAEQAFSDGTTAPSPAYAERSRTPQIFAERGK